MEGTARRTIFETLNSINVNEHTESKNGLTYLSWAWAWQMVKKYFPDATYTVYERPDGRPYWDDGRTCWVKTGVTIEGLEHIEYLPVMDNRNNSIPVEKVTSFDMNKAIQRSLTKAAARHGLGLYIYAGEDLPNEEQEQRKAEAEQKRRTKKTIGPQPEQAQSMAAAKPAPAPKAEPDPNDLLPGGKTYCLIVKKYAEGKKSKTGEDYRTVWGRMVNPSEDLLERFDYDVATYRMNAGIQPAF